LSKNDQDQEILSAYLDVILESSHIQDKEHLKKEFKMKDRNQYPAVKSWLLLFTALCLNVYASDFDPKKIIQDMNKAIEELTALKSEPGTNPEEIDKIIEESVKARDKIQQQYNLKEETGTAQPSFENTKKADSPPSQPAPVIIKPHSLPNADKQEIIQKSKFIMEASHKLRNIASDKIILYGPKSNGRLWIAKKKAEDIGAHFIYISGYDIGSEKFGGNGKKTLKNLLSDAEQHKGKTVIFIDEIEQLIKGGIGAAFSIPDEFIVFLEQVKSRGICLIVGTDHFDLIDQNLLKPDRLNKYFNIEKPTLDQRRDVLTKLLTELRANQIDKIAETTHQFAFDELFDLAALAHSEQKTITEQHVFAALKQYKKQKFAQDYSTLVRDLDSGLSIIKPEQVNTRFTDIIGMEEPIEQIRDILDFIKSPDIFSQKGINPPKGLIFYGPPGNGKTHLVRALAGETNATFISTTGSYFYNSEYKHNPSDPNFLGQVKDPIQKIRNVFELARQLSPSIIFIDEFEIIGKAREISSSDGVSKVNQFLTEMDGLIQENQGHVFVVAATNYLDSMDSALLRPGRFDRHIAIGYPKHAEREKLIKGFLSRIQIPFKDEVGPVVDMTAGMSVAYLKNLTNEAGLIALRQKQDTLTLDNFKAAHQKLQANLAKIPPSQNDRTSGSSPNFEFLMPEQLQINFDHIGGYSKEKNQIKQFLELIKNPEKLNKLGARPIKGVVLHGPPGTGKTMLARALASEAKLSFISCNGSQFENGGAQRVRDLFTTARSVAPCIIFIDEFDSVAKDRKESGTSSHNIINQFLSELDGIDSSKNQQIFVVITTNHLEALDKALIRAGRFDRHIYVGLPSAQDRTEIADKLLERYTAPGIKGKDIAQATDGFSPAELQNVLNEAAIEATMMKQEAITWENIKNAIKIVRPE
jgi:transitional endoplasmic reticulum ATPase